MEQLTLTTPALLFSAISLIMLAYTNRFLAYASVIRNLHDRYLKEHDDSLLRQINNLKQRLHLTKWMQIFGIQPLEGRIDDENFSAQRKSSEKRNCRFTPQVCIGTNFS